MELRCCGTTLDFEIRFLILAGITGSGKTQLSVLEQGIRYGARWRDLVGARRKAKFFERERDHLRRLDVLKLGFSRKRG
ncbi:hypothetical protein D8B23_01840 [Verminephrobacter aporrectodeae subsp. tuberculatae]|nr:hypothetical protein [Verminephrobacter aporrectodeae subsp. tuberculatae]MCW5288337.1 hypothetical protein [Verminephrobacter aporrectodeae subsp. tuberculatae]MCW8197190.1 hypothetical protein [Verminephrobacter aporrectodeae subsp. tuberculatae]